MSYPFYVGHHGHRDWPAKGSQAWSLELCICEQLNKVNTAGTAIMLAHETPH